MPAEYKILCLNTKTQKYLIKIVYIQQIP